MDKLSNYVHLHVHTIYSLLDGMTDVKKLAKKAASLGMKAVAITDHGAMYGCVAFHEAMREAGVKPIIGCEFYVAPSSRFNKGENNGEKEDMYYHLILLAKNEEGYKNLCRLVTMANKEGFYYKPRIDFELLEKFHDGLICLSACLAGELPRKIIKMVNSVGSDKEAAEVDVRNTINAYHNLFGEDYYFEVQNHGIPEESLVAQELIRLSAETGIKAVCTNDCHYLDSEDAEAHDWLLCMQTKKKITDTDRMRYTGDYSFKSEDEMRKLFPGNPELFTNTLEIADKCDFRFKFAPKEVEYRMPVVRIPEKYYNDYFGYLKDEAYNGLDNRYPEGHPEREQAKENLEFELGIIKSMGFAEYFLDTRKTILWARAHGCLVGPGRGSGAGSTLNYCLTITDLDPIKYGLLFERFLNPERVSMPDIDVDYQDSRKDDVIASEAESNGHEFFCKIQALGGLKAKQVLKDTARVAGLTVADGNILSKLIPNDPKMTLEKAIKENPVIESVLNNNATYRKVWSIATKLEGLKKSAGTHACGHIPTPVPCEELFPCSVDKETGYLVCQYDMAEAEHLGNLKKDLLMLRNLTIISAAQKAIKVNHGVDIPLWTDRILNDEDALKLFWTGDTNGVFQFESEGMKKFMAELQPTCFEDIIAGVSLYRPGPMDYIPDYIEGKHNPGSITYDFPELKPILAPTYGVITYQEQVMQIVQKLAGFSKGEADVVRKGMGKKKMDIIEAEGKKFIDGDDKFPGCVKNGLDRAKAEALWVKMAKFGEYAFNKSHAACYAAISMQTAYIKAHYPLEFYAALFTSVMGKTALLKKYIHEAKSKGIEVMEPSINTSTEVFEAVAESGKISFAITALKGLGDSVVKGIIREREKNGPYSGIVELMMRNSECKLNKGGIESLVKAGALDCFGHTRAAMLEALPVLAKKVQKLKKKGTASSEPQLSLFDLYGEQMGIEAKGLNFEMQDDIIEMPELKRELLLEYEKEAAGRYISGHPFEAYDNRIRVEGYALTSLSAFETEEDDNDESDTDNAVEDTGDSDAANTALVDGQAVAVAGIIRDGKMFFTKKDSKPMKVFYLEDVEGYAKIVVFPKAYARLSGESVSLMDDGTPVVVTGKVMVDQQDGSYSVMADNIYSLKCCRKFVKATVSDEEYHDGWLYKERNASGTDIIRLSNRDTGLRMDIPFAYSDAFQASLETSGVDYSLMYLVSTHR